jgi:hypothetical protein
VKRSTDQKSSSSAAANPGEHRFHPIVKFVERHIALRDVAEAMSKADILRRVDTRILVR